MKMMKIKLILKAIPEGQIYQKDGAWYKKTSTGAVKIGRNKEEADKFISRQRDMASTGAKKDEKKVSHNNIKVGAKVRINSTAKNVGRGVVAKIKEVGKDFVRVVDDMGRVFRVDSQQLAYAKSLADGTYEMLIKHKYTDKKLVNNKWRYTYDEPKGKKQESKKDTPSLKKLKSELRDLINATDGGKAFDEALEGFNPNSKYETEASIKKAIKKLKILKIKQDKKSKPKTNKKFEEAVEQLEDHMDERDIEDVYDLAEDLSATDKDEPNLDDFSDSELREYAIERFIDTHSRKDLASAVQELENDYNDDGM